MREWKVKLKAKGPTKFYEDQQNYKFWLHLIKTIEWFISISKTMMIVFGHEIRLISY